MTAPTLPATVRAERTASHHVTPVGPTLWSVALLRTRIEVRSFLRHKEAVVFNLCFPILLLALFGSIFSGELPGTGISVKQMLVSGVIASGLMTVSFQNLAIGVALDRDDGTIKRLVGLPVPRSAYFLGKVGLVATLVLLEVALLLGVGVVAFGLTIPTDPAKIATFLGVVLLGIASCSMLGIAYSSLARSGKNASAVVAPPFIVLQFISGVWLRFGELPAILRSVAELFPLRWMVQGLQSVFLPDTFAEHELGGGWDLHMVFGVLVAWTVASFLLCRLTFRWTGDRR